MRRTRFIIALLVVLVAGAAVASAASERKTLRHSRTFSLRAGKTRTFKVGYPDGLKYGGSKYSGAVSVVPPPSCGPRNNPCPKPRKVHVLSKGSCDGASDFCVRVRNTNASATTSFFVCVTAITELPPGKRR